MSWPANRCRQRHLLLWIQKLISHLDSTINVLCLFFSISHSCSFVTPMTPSSYLCHVRCSLWCVRTPKQENDNHNIQIWPNLSFEKKILAHRPVTCERLSCRSGVTESKGHVPTCHKLHSRPSKNDQRLKLHNTILHVWHSCESSVLFWNALFWKSNIFSESFIAWPPAQMTG